MANALKLSIMMLKLDRKGASFSPLMGGWRDWISCRLIHANKVEEYQELCYCVCVNDAGGKLHPSPLCAWTEGSSLSLILSLLHFSCHSSSVLLLLLQLRFMRELRKFSSFSIPNKIACMETENLISGHLQTYL